MLQAIGRRYRTTSSLRGLTTVHPIAAGDMHGIGGIGGIGHLAREPGLLARVFAGSLPSEPSAFEPSAFEPPAIRRPIESGGVQADNIPSGVLFQMHRAAATRQPGNRECSPTSDPAPSPIPARAAPG